MTFRHPRLTLEQKDFARKTIAARLTALGGDGVTFRPGSLLYTAMSAGLQAGNSRLDPAHRIEVSTVLSTVCQDTYRDVQRGHYVYHLADDIFHDLLLGDIQEEDARFVSHGNAVHVAHQTFSAALDQDTNWMNLVAQEREARCRGQLR